MQPVGFLPRIFAYLLDGVLVTVTMVVAMFLLFGLMGLGIGALGIPTGHELAAKIEAMDEQQMTTFSEDHSAEELQAFKSDLMAFAGLSITFMLAFLLIALIPFVYWLAEAFFAATPGKFVLGIRVADISGSRASRKQLFSRFALKHFLVVGFVGITIVLLSATFILPEQIVMNIVGLMVLVLFAGSLLIFLGQFMMFGADKRALYDIVSGTAVYPAHSVADSAQVVQSKSEFVRDRSVPARDSNELLKPRW